MKRIELPASAAKRVARDFAGARVGDERRNRRAQAIVAKLARRPSATLPEALGSDAELEGCYRLVNNRAVRMQDLLAGHIEATGQRARKAGSVLVVHDTTDCTFAHLSPKEVGYLQTGKAGFKLHAALVLDAESWRRPLGVVHAETLHRTERSKRGRQCKASGIETAKWQNRESSRWWRGMDAAAKALAECERVIHVADREGDSYELLAKLIDTKQRFVIRVRVDRRGQRTGSDPDVWSTVKQLASTCKGVLARDVPLSSRAAKATARMTGAHPPRRARLARLEVAAMRVVIPKPRYLKKPQTLALNLVHVRERHPPEGEPAVEWLLYTSEAIDTSSQLESVVDHYRARWTIEEFNAALKTGCAYEEREFESRHALLAMLALSLPIACEALALRSLARSHPTSAATGVLSEQQLEILHALSPRSLPSSPTVADALLCVAALGGHLRRNGPPGWKILQRGMTLLLAYEVGWAAARSPTAAIQM